MNNSLLQNDLVSLYFFPLYKTYLQKNISIISHNFKKNSYYIKIVLKYTETSFWKGFVKC